MIAGQNGAQFLKKFFVLLAYMGLLFYCYRPELQPYGTFVLSLFHGICVGLLVGRIK